MMELTKVEKEIVRAYRDGANVKVTYHGTDSSELAIHRVGRFGGVSDIIDLTYNETVQFVAFQNIEHNGLEVNAFVNVDK